MSEETKYPIYSISATWFEPQKDGQEYSESRTKNAPPGMFCNSTSFYKAFRQEPKSDELEQVAREWWGRYSISERRQGANSPVIVISFVEHETWWLTWFQHETFDVGQSNKEALSSFEHYVRRKELQGKTEHGDSGYLLMGADDRYRWHGAEPDGACESRSEPPCRCKFCKEAGLIRVGH